jgi:hypothetical protein
MGAGSQTGTTGVAAGSWSLPEQADKADDDAPEAEATA